MAGLGNPGPKYQRNRHNIGYMAVDEIVRRHSFGAWRARFQSLAAEGRIAGEKVLAIKPATYMNESGRAVGEALRFYKLEPPQLTVFYDEIDLAFGKIRVRRGGGLAGHNGLRSIDAHIGPDFRRVRVGVGHPGDKHRVHGHVLGDFSKAEVPLKDKIVDAIAECAPLLVRGEDSAFMSKVALIVFPPPPKPPRKDDGDNGNEETES
ncbi:MAG: aminoacyl-tRNA hydrolase [Alphaproteobacteria bacterium]